MNRSWLVSARVASAALVLCLLGGCFGGGQVPESRYYVLEYEEGTSINAADGLDVVVGVDAFATQPLYRDRRVAYRVSGVEMAYYPYRYWAAPPGELVASQLARHLRQQKVVKAVLESPFEIQPDWIVTGRVQRFEEVDRGPSWAAVCEISVRIESYLDREVIAEETWREEVPTRARTPDAVATAMSEAVHAIGVQVERLLRESLAAQ